MTATTTQLGQRGTLVIPAALRRALGIQVGALLLLEVDGNSLVIRPARAVPVEEYTSIRRAQFLLNSAIDAEDYARARGLVEKMGIDPDAVQHERPE